MMDTRKAIGHEYGPTPDATLTRRCPICGKPFIYSGGWCVGSTPVCSYSCQRQLVAQYKQSREYKRIQEELNPPKKPQRQRLISDIEVLEMPDGPLNRDQLITLHKMYPRREFESFQQIAELVLAGRTSIDIMTIVGVNDHVVSNIRKMLGCTRRPGRAFKLTEEERNAIIAKRKEGMLIKDIALEYHVTRETLRKVLADDSGSYYTGRR